MSVVAIRGVPVPQLAGQPAVNTSLRQVASGLAAGCRVATVRDRGELASFRWVCGVRVATATYSLADGRRLVLGDLLTGGYQTYLMSGAAAQLQADGVANPSVGALSTWCVAADSLEVTFPGGTVSFPLSGLQPFLRRPGLLAGG